MNSKKKLNLLPDEVKNRYANRYLAYTASVLGGIMVLLLVIQYVQIGMLSWQTNRIIEKNEKYDNEKNVIVDLEKSIKQYQTFLSDYENDCFPFSLFMYDIESKRPSDVFIISVDSEDRLINEGVQNKKQPENAEDTKKSEGETQNDKEQAAENDNAAQNSEKQADEKAEKAAEPEIKYTEDLSGQRIVIRGYGGKQESISNFIYDIAHLSYINNAEITAIEEHKIENGVYNIFEITVTGGVYN